MRDKALTFADDFAAADPAGAASMEDWRRLAEKALKERSLKEALVSQSDEGIRIPALSSAADGISPMGIAGRAGHQGHWDIRQAALHPGPVIANQEILADLAGGATSLALVLNAASAGGDMAAQGVMVTNLGALDQVLDGVLLDVALVSLVAGTASFAAAAALTALWQQRGVADDKAKAWFNADPLNDLALAGKLSGGLDAAYDRMADLAKTSAGRWVNVRSIAVTTHAYHGAGCGEAQELALALATGVEYLRALEKRGMDPGAAAGEIVFRVTADADIFLTIAKLRALRSLWARVLAACGVSAEAQIEATTAPRMFAGVDMPVNILRATAACMAGAVGGADAITVLPHTFSAGLADRPARRIARNLQVILAEEESRLAHVTDPAAGAWAIEALSGELCTAAWKMFQQIESHGGMFAVLSSGWIQGEIGRVRAKRAQAIAAKEKRLTGVNSFADPDAPALDILAPDVSGLKAAAANQRLAGLSFAEAISAMGEGASFADFIASGEGDSALPLSAQRLSQPFEGQGS